ncbi:MAG TPA: Ig-like domain-containing protein [Candidatus Tectomicrobia bacterium]|nr:Ig-like domain-containing protein [Candidatus Tectomicrobia bacterium]
MTGVLGIALMALATAPAAIAQTTLVGGGLTELPVVKLGPDVIKNGGFETLSGGLPASWSGGSGWSMDQLVKHGGAFSYRRTTGAPTASQTLQLRAGTYRLTGWVRTENLGGGTTSGVRLQWDLRPTQNSWTNTQVISGTRDWTRFELPNLVLTRDSTVTVKLENYGNPSGTAWFDDIRVEEQLPQAVDAFLLYPNFRGMLFDDGPSALKFAVDVTPPGGDMARHEVRLTLRDESTGQVLGTRTFPAASSLTAEIDGGGMQHGRRYLATVSLVDRSSGSVVFSYPAYRVSRVPASARQSMNVSFDAKNRVLVRGVPRFVLGVYDSGSGYSTQDSFWENQLWSPTGERRMDGMKINFYLNYWYGSAPADAMKALMANLQKRGVMYLQTGNCFNTFAAGSDFLINSSDAYVQDIGAHGGSGGYYTIDECVSSLIPGAFQQYRRLRELDPDGITFSANFGNPDLHLWRDAADIISTDPYPLYASEPAGGYNHGQVASWTRVSREAVKDARPIMTVLQFFKFTSLGRWPTRQEMRNHAYMAIVEGARGLWWWSLGVNALRNVCSGWCAEKIAYMDNLKSVVNEIAALEPALLADDSPGSLTGNSNGAAIKTKVKVVNGKGYVFAYNATNASASATFTWAQATGGVTVHGESRSLGSGTSFTDSFGPYQAHVYVIANGGTTSGGGDTGGGDTGGGTTTPTVAFSNPPAGATVSGTTTVTMTASGGSSPYTYRLAVDGTTIYTGANGTFGWNTTAVANGSHTLTATVTDSGGRTASATRTVTVSNTTTTPPPAGTLQVAITAPRSGATVSGTTWATVWVEGAGTASKTYTLLVGGQTVATTTTTSSGPVSLPWDTTKTANGTQTLTARVQEGTNAGTSSVSVNVSNAASAPAPVPALTVGFTSPAAGATVSGTVTVGLTASGGSGGYTYTLRVDGGAPVTLSGASYAWNTTAVANGSHTLTATVTDSGGATATATRTVTVSNTTPPPPSSALQVHITQPTAGAIVNGTTWVTVWVEGASAGSKTYRLVVDGATVDSSTTTSSGPVSLRWKTSGRGARTLTVSVRDAAGSTGTASVGVTVRN